MISIRHIGIVVNNIDKSLSFYRGLLGFEVVRDMDEKGNIIDVFLNMKGVNVRTVKLKDSNGIMIELLKFYSHPKDLNLNVDNQLVNIGCSHFALTIDNLDKLYQKLKKKKVYFLSEPQTTSDNGVKVVFCKDPDGTFIELVEVLK